MEVLFPTTPPGEPPPQLVPDNLAREDLRITIVTWIERTYHRRRRQNSLGRLTTIEFESLMTAPATQAA
jgi:hypothetical protein